MHITIVQGAFLPVPPILGGAVEKRWFELGKQFASHGHQVVQVSRTYNDLPVRESIDGVLHLRVRGHDIPRSMLRLKFLDLLYTLRALRVVTGSDILVSNTFFLPIFSRARSKGALYVDVARTPRGQIRLYRHAARLRANSRAVAEAIINECPSATRRVRVIPNPLPFTPLDAVEFERKQRIILYAGRVHPEKGIELLVRAFHRLSANDMRDWKLEIAGPWQTSLGGGGERYFEHLRGMSANLPIHWHGLIHDKDKLNGLYRNARVFCYPSLAEKGETFGLAPLEAMAWGCLPVVSDLACFRDFIINGENGIVFDHRSTDPIAELVAKMTIASKSNEQINAMARRTVEVRQSHSLEKIARCFLLDFESLIT